MTELSDPPLPTDAAQAAHLLESYQKLRAEMAKVLVGQEDVIQLLLIAILARGHCLLEGVPGLAKTLMVRTLASALKLKFRRVQFTPDLMPSDITGTEIIQEEAGGGGRRLVFQPGPVFTQILLADEINRAPAKTQAALLEAMQEGSVTTGGSTRPLGQPFFVLATQNPVEQEGTYQLPEAQRDRFLFLIKVGYPALEEEIAIMERTTGVGSAEIQPVMDEGELLMLQDTVRRVPIPPYVMDHAVRLVRAARPTEDNPAQWVRDGIAWGPGPRAGQFLLLGAKVRALLQGRHHVVPEDVRALAGPVLRHRIVPSFRAEAEGTSTDALVERLLKEVPAPKGKV